MKELALLMFFVGCGYALTQFSNHLRQTNIRHLYFRIPSAASFNILWGFVFYTSFGILNIPSHSLKFTLGLILLILLGYLFRQYLLKRYFSRQTPEFIKHLVIHNLHRQQETDKKFNIPYSRTDALRLLGLPTTLTDTDPRITRQMALLNNLNLPPADNALLADLQRQLRQALSLK